MVRHLEIDLLLMSGENKTNHGLEQFRTETYDKFERLENEIKERETSVLRAVRTVLKDYKNNPQEFPQSAFIGLIFAYLRPRVTIVIGSVLAGVFAFLQLFVLFRQTELMRNQKDIEAFAVTNFVIEQLKPEASNLSKVSMDGIFEKRVNIPVQPLIYVPV